MVEPLLQVSAETILPKAKFNTILFNWLTLHHLASTPERLVENLAGIGFALDHEEIERTCKRYAGEALLDKETIAGQISHLSFYLPEGEGWEEFFDHFVLPPGFEHHEFVTMCEEPIKEVRTSFFRRTQPVIDDSSVIPFPVLSTRYFSIDPDPSTGRIRLVFGLAEGDNISAFLPEFPANMRSFLGKN